MPTELFPIIGPSLVYNCGTPARFAWSGLGGLVGAEYSAQTRPSRLSSRARFRELSLVLGIALGSKHENDRLCSRLSEDQIPDLFDVELAGLRILIVQAIRVFACATREKNIVTLAEPADGPDKTDSPQ